MFKKIILFILFASIPALCVGYSAWTLLEYIRTQTSEQSWMQIQASVREKDFTSAGAKGIAMPTYHITYTYTVDGLPDLFTRDERVDEDTYRAVGQNSRMEILVNPMHHRRTIIKGNTLYKEHFLKATALDIVLGIFIFALVRIQNKSKKEEILVLDQDHIRGDIESYLQSFSDMKYTCAQIHIDMHYSIDNWEPVFRELFRVLKPNSPVLLACWLEERVPVHTDREIEQQQKIASLLRKEKKYIDRVEQGMRNNLVKNGFDVQAANIPHYQTAFFLVPIAQQCGFVLEYAPAWDSYVDGENDLVKRFTVIRLWKL